MYFSYVFNYVTLDMEKKTVYNNLFLNFCHLLNSNGMVPYSRKQFTIFHKSNTSSAIVLGSEGGTKVFESKS
jgi:hypothetical protein